MRTTVTLDPDVERMLETAIRERGISFKQALNDAVRKGLQGAPGPKRRFVQKTCSMGWDPHFRWDKALALSDAIEDEESIRKLSMRK
jgi:hypothetical protein